MEQSRDTRPESDIFRDLERLCSSPGYAHALACLCWKSNFIGYADALKHADLYNMKTHERLLRSEINILTGLLVKSPIDFQRPSNAKLQDFIDRSEALLAELHRLMQQPMKQTISNLVRGETEGNPLSRGAVLREAISYSGEAAYMFQYRDFASQRYANDEQWFQNNVGFLPTQLQTFVKVLADLQVEKLESLKAKARANKLPELTILPMFSFTVDELIDQLGFGQKTIENIIKAFSVSSLPGNQQFNEFGAYNETCARPILPLNEDGDYLLLQTYSLAESSYDSPFFWMLDDPSYKDESLKNRGLFTEKFAVGRLRDVLGADHVYENVFILDSNGQRAGEIDVLAIYADRAIVLQAKSKKLTLAARKGDDDAIRSDFQKAVQDSYNQGYSCAELLIDKNYRLAKEDGSTLSVRREFAEVFVFCVISEYYPALSYQAHLFLQQQDHPTIRPAYVMDVFFLDALCELLNTPLHFFNFIHRRLHVFDQVTSENEMAVLSFHLVYNLWFEEKYDSIDLGDDFSTYLDVAMLARREGLPGKKTPEGILTKLRGTSFDRIVSEIGEYEADNALEMGYHLLSMSEDAARQFSEACDFILNATASDGKMHDFSLGTGSDGITIHSSLASDVEASEKLRAHCETKKYQLKADKWFGLLLWPNRTTLTRMALGLNHVWEQSDEMDRFLEMFQTQGPTKTVKHAIRNYKTQLHRKVGRNDTCPCGSGMKFKKCCLRKSRTK